MYFKRSLKLNHKERVIASINMEEPDRVPWCAYFGFAPSLYKKLCAHFGVRVHLVDNDFPELYKKLNFDIIISNPRSPIGFPKLLPDGSYQDHFGVTYMNFNGYSERPIKHPLMNFNVEDLENYEFPNPEIMLLDSVDSCINKYGDMYAIMSGFGYTLFERAWTLRGFTQSLKDFYINPPFMEKMLDKITTYDIELTKLIVEKPLDIFWIGDDYSDQKGMLMSPSIWRKFIKPRLAKIVDIPRKKGIPVFLHCDGNPTDILNDLIEIGITILNPVQPLAIDPKYVKENFGDELCLFGTIDIQRTLPFGTSKDVEKEIITRMETCGHNGGLILSPTHSVPPDVPVANIITLVKAIQKYGQYPTFS